MRCESSTRCSTSASSRSRSAEQKPERRPWTASALAALVLALAPGAARAEMTPLQHSPRVASYTLHATLDAHEHRVHGKGSIELFNYTEKPLSEVYLHLYMNAFKNDQSLFLRSPFGAGRSGQHGTSWGYIDVKRLYGRELGTELWPGRVLKNPDDPEDDD